MQEFIAKGIVEFGLKRLNDSLSKTQTTLRVSTEDLEAALDHHLRSTKNWCSEVSFADLRSSKATDQAFVALDVLLHPRRYRISAAETGDVLPLEEAIARTIDESRLSRNQSSQDAAQGRHLVILGQPGAGKTTSMKHLCRRVLTDDTFLADVLQFPILIRLRELNHRPGMYNNEIRISDDDILVSHLQETLGIRLSFPVGLESPENAAQRRAIRDRAVIDYIDNLRVLLVLDGFDEIASRSRRDSILEEIRRLAQQFDHSCIILTSRTGEFNYHIDNANQFEIHGLSEEQIHLFLDRWLGPADGGRLFEHVQRSPYADTAIRPLTLAHLCAIFERTRQFPEKPKTIYNKIINLLIENWDEQRSVTRESAYSHFDIYRKHEFLSHMAYVLTVRLRSSAFSKDDLANAYTQIYDNFGLPLSDASKVANELESHTGLFIQAGFDQFEFSHKSLQEFLAAEFIVKLPSIPNDPRMLKRIPNELAIATAISSRPSAYFAQLVCNRFSSMPSDFEFTRAFVNRLLIERPDFEMNGNAGIALLALYSYYLGAVVHGPAQLDLFVIDRLRAEFSQLGSLIKDRLNKDDLLRVFEVVAKPEALDGETVVQLVKRMENRRTPSGHPDSKGKEVLRKSRHHDSDQSGDFDMLPDVIWIREQLFTGMI